ncbi:hypothetical protein G6F56_009534 [Rhizopus delemar]|nr:hypothetical protein G6F56_009534 [Rhizopus delemar]
MSVQESRNIEANTNDERIIPMDVSKTSVSLLGRRTHADGATFQCQQLFNDIQMSSTMTNKAVFCKDVPQGIEDRNKARLESIAERVHIRLTECIGY